MEQRTLSAGGFVYFSGKKHLCSPIHSSHKVLDALKEESRALREAMRMFDGLSFQENVLPSELATIKETKIYLERRRQLVVSMRRLLMFSDKK